MKERIRQIAEGVIDNPPACRFVPEHLTGTAAKGTVVKREIEIRTEDGRPVRGVAYSDCPNIRIRQNSFKGYRNHIYIEVDTVGLHPGSTLSGQLVFVTEGGERQLDYEFAISEADSVRRADTLVVDFSGKANEQADTVKSAEQTEAESIPEQSAAEETELPEQTEWFQQYLEERQQEKSVEDSAFWDELIHRMEQKNCRGEQWYPWLREAALRNVKSEYLMTAYMESIPEENQDQIARPIVLYYMYGDSLSERLRERLYANVQMYYRDDAVVYGEYRKRIESYMLDHLMHRQINAELQVLYSSMLRPELLSEHLADCVADILSMEHIRISAAEAAAVQITYPHLMRRDAVLLENGEADISVWNDAAQLTFLDGNGAEVSEPIGIERTKWLVSEALVAACAQLAPTHLRYRISGLYRALEEGAASAEEAEKLIAIANSLPLQEQAVQRVVSVLIAFAAAHPEETVCDGVLLGADWNLLSAAERSQVVRLLSDKGYAAEALRTVRQHGWQELEESVLCPLLQQSVQQSSGREQWQIELCAWLYEKGVRAAWLLEQLCLFYNHSCSRMCSLLEECRKEEYGLARETLLALTERILIQSLYSSRWKELPALMEQYISYGGSSELLLKAYLVVQSCQYYMTGVSDRILEDWISYEPLRQPFHRNMPEICSLAVLKRLSACEERTEEQNSVCTELLTALVNKKRYYQFLHKFRDLIEIPEELAGKVILEYHGVQKKCVRLEYRWDSSAEELQSTVLREYCPGVYCTELMLFAEEMPEYRLYEEDEYQAVAFEIEEPFAQKNQMCELLNAAISAYYHGTVQEAQEAICRLEETAYLCERMFG